MSKGHTWACIAAAGILFNALHAEIIVIEQPQSRAAAEGKQVEFSVQAQSSTPVAYQWQFNGSDIPHAVSHTIHFTATMSRAGTYRVVMNDGAGGSSSATAQLEVQKRPVILK